MRTHQQIDQRSLLLAQAVADKLDADPEHRGLELARENCRRWYQNSPSPAIAEWIQILKNDWPQVREILLDPGEHGQRRRQSSPFAGLLTPKERWAIYEKFQNDQEKR